MRYKQLLWHYIPFGVVRTATRRFIQSSFGTKVAFGTLLCMLSYISFVGANLLRQAGLSTFKRRERNCETIRELRHNNLRTVE